MQAGVLPPRSLHQASFPGLAHSHAKSGPPDLGSSRGDAVRGKSFVMVRWGAPMSTACRYRG
jgi:hypothetical protein